MTNPAHLTRDDAHTARTERMEQLQKQHPDTDLQIESGWWKPATDFAFDVKEKLDKPTADKMDAILMKLFGKDVEPCAEEKVMQESRECLEGHPDLLERFDTIFKSAGSEMWATVEMMRQQRGGCARK